MTNYKDSPIMGYLYRNASSDYISEVGIPNPEIRNQWIKNKVQEDYEYYFNQEPIIQELLESYRTRLNKENQQTLC